jgi:hypothetical protein
MGRFNYQRRESGASAGVSRSRDSERGATTEEVLLTVRSGTETIARIVRETPKDSPKAGRDPEEPTNHPVPPSRIASGCRSIGNGVRD